MDEVDHITIGPDGTVILTPEYAAWLASWMAEECDCSLFMTHGECILEAEAFVKRFMKR